MSTAVTKQQQNAGVYLPAPTSFEEAYRIAKVLAASDLVPKDYRDKPENCLVAMQWGADVGLPGLQALQNIAVINGRPSIWGDAAKALCLNSSDCEQIEESIEGEGDNMVAVCIAKRKGSKPVEQRFSVADAKKAGLWGKSGPWQSYPKRMLQMRARGFALRDAFPDALRGLSIAEESQDIVEVELNPMPAKTAPSMPKSVEKAAPTNVDTSTGEVIEGKAETVREEPIKEAPKKPAAKQAEAKPAETKPVETKQAEAKQEPAHSPEQKQAQHDESPLAPAGMLIFLRKKIEGKNLPMEVVLAEHEIESLDGITETKAIAIRDWIAQQENQ